jgi:hypothetical protein
MSAQTPLLIGTGIAAVVFGISSVGYAGLCTQITLTHDGEVSVIYDGNGFTIGRIFFDDKDEVDVQMILQSSDTVPTRGTILTVAGVDGFQVDSNQRIWSQREQAKWSFKATRNVNLVTS